MPSAFPSGGLTGFPQLCLISPNKSQAQLNPDVCLAAITPSLCPWGGRWVASSSPVLLSCSGWDLRKPFCSTRWGEGPGWRARFAVCGLGHSDWLARGLQAESCFGYWGCNVSMESVQQEKGVGAGRRGVVREAGSGFFRGGACQGRVPAGWGGAGRSERLVERCGRRSGLTGAVRS